jgi:hypothetical protein
LTKWVQYKFATFITYPNSPAFQSQRHQYPHYYYLNKIFVE